jgi:hypothetical protein
VSLKATPLVFQRRAQGAVQKVLISISDVFSVVSEEFRFIEQQATSTFDIQI